MSAANISFTDLNSRVLAISLGRGPSGAEGRVVSWDNIFGEIAREYRSSEGWNE